MVDRAYRLNRILAGLVFMCFGVGVSCAFGPGDLDAAPIPGPSRRLDEACRVKGCVVTGSAAIVSGLSSDSAGIRVGPGPGTATIILDSAGQIPPDYDWDVELLSSGVGSFAVTGPGCATTMQAVNQTLAPSSEYQWISVGARCPSSDFAHRVSVSITGQDNSSVLEVADIRIVAHIESGAGCSIGRRARMTLPDSRHQNGSSER